jgi:hypothetical protein
MLKTLKVVQQGEPTQIDSQKTENGKLAKCSLVLQEIGGKYANSYMVTLFGNDAMSQFYPGELVLVKLKFQVREYNGQLFQDINVQEIIKLKF